MATETVPYARAARRHLSKVDPVLKRIITEVGPLVMYQRPERFQALVRAIIFQQLAGPAALAIYNRFVALYPEREFPTPAEVLATSEATLRKCGLSAKKTLYVKDLAAHIERGAIDFHRFPAMSDAEIVEHLTQVKGIGPWTAEIFLMFNLGRPDVFPFDDLGLWNAVQRAYRMRARPDKKRLRKMAERWRPYRSAAAWYFWQSLRITLPGASPPRTDPSPSRAPVATSSIARSSRPRVTPAARLGSRRS
ncbi:MAG TPA: DNA-3-methyladenine glycosylase [Candidatus Binataceae bacterium]|nr:DNA-3-methyladenine glycosylase [Candidatus Binataceae bacterium]